MISSPSLSLAIPLSMTRPVERFCSYADRRPVILCGPQAAFRLRAEARERAMLIQEKMKCSATS
jgi:hypothetical protein